MLGWEWHQIQQRGFVTNVQSRREEIIQFYNTLDITLAKDFLTKMGDPSDLEKSPEHREVSKDQRHDAWEYGMDCASELVKRAAEIGIETGAKITGLGAFTSIVTKGGTYLSDLDTGLTTGNSYTLAVVMESIHQVAEKMKIRLSPSLIAVMVWLKAPSVVSV